MFFQTKMPCSGTQRQAGGGQLAGSLRTSAPFGNIYFKAPAVWCTETRQSSPVSHNTEASEDRAAGYVTVSLNWGNSPCPSGCFYFRRWLSRQCEWMAHEVIVFLPCWGFEVTLTFSLGRPRVLPPFPWASLYMCTSGSQLSVFKL